MKETTIDKAHALDSKKLQAQLTRNWHFLGAMTVAASVGLAMSLAPTIEATLSDFWPWGNTNIVLLAALAAALISLVGYLTYQQRKIGAVREHFDKMEAESGRVTRRQKNRIHALLNVSRMMGAVSDLEDMFTAVTEMCIDIFDAEQASLMILNRETQELEVRAATGHEPERAEKVKQATHQLGEGISGWVAAHQKAVNLSPGVDVRQFEGLELKRKHVSAAMVVPILVRDELVGVLSVSSRRETGSFTDMDLEALSVFAESAGSCIRHCERAKWMRQMIENQKGMSITGMFNAQQKPEPTT